MKIKGLLKTTVIDYPDKIACTIFLFGCNFRCGFCHNPELVLEDDFDQLTEEEVLEFLDKRKGQLEGICITGGEPLMTIDFDFLRKIKQKGYSIKLDTNGSYPEKLKKIIDEGLVDYLAMDIKTSREKYSDVANVLVDLNKIEDSIKLIANSGLDYEFRTTYVSEMHDLEIIKNVGIWLNELIGGKPKKFVLQGFKNYGKFIDSSFSDKENVFEEDLKKVQKEIKDYFERVEIRV